MILLSPTMQCITSPWGENLQKPALRALRVTERRIVDKSIQIAEIIDKYIVIDRLDRPI